VIRRRRHSAHPQFLSLFLNARDLDVVSVADAHFAQRDETHYSGDSAEAYMEMGGGGSHWGEGNKQRLAARESEDK
jgi:hypothetical protein